MGGVERRANASMALVQALKQDQVKSGSRDTDHGEQKSAKSGFRRTLSGRLPSMYSEDHADMPAVTAAQMTTGVSTVASGKKVRRSSTSLAHLTGSMVSRSGGLANIRAAGSSEELLHVRTKSVGL